jgi:NAD-dependent SIR2 family protein deacetylase
MSTNNVDPWMEHLRKFDLLEMHAAAQKAGYRVRVATGYIFHLEYEGGLDKYYQRGLAVKEFEDTKQGRADALAFIETVKQEIAKVRASLENATCEACGQQFKKSEGYFDEGEYSYCANCCKW